MTGRCSEPITRESTDHHTCPLKHHQCRSLLRFLDDPTIPPTNNAAERDLRSGVSARKVSHCSKTQGGADSYAMIKSIVETAKRHKQYPLDVMVGLQVRAAPR
ncbi:IS66 family transposase [Deinococcus alpinitundrae]|uniref:IS66 family transposase n=1 Tax=Deinococcus alpinitundrae TaxID=468913 RepID=UPI00137A7C3D|nr:transposase [Deinococcus alpinitundrae]